MIALNKALALADLDDPDMAAALAVVDQHFTKDSPQHVYRRWEYGLALLAVNRWGGAIRHVLDIGGAGSPFWRMLDSWQVQVIDPAIDGQALEAYVLGAGRLADVVCCLSVLEHVEEVETFLYHLACAVRPGGLLVLTMDSCGDPGVTCPDPHHYNWMRQRIFTARGVERLRERLAEYGFRLFGDQDDTGGTTQVIHDYTFRSLVMTKRVR